METSSPDLLIARAARRARLTWEAGVTLSRKMKDAGATPEEVEKWKSKLATAVLG